MSEFEKTIVFDPAYDRRNPDPRKNYGIHGVEMRFLLKGPRGVVQFALSTNWQLKHVRDEQHRRILEEAGHGVTNEYADPKHKKLSLCSLHVTYDPMPLDRGYHSPEPIYEGQEPQSENCLYLGGRCYYDGSGLNAESLFETLITKGSDGVWEELEQYYHRVFDTPIEKIKMIPRCPGRP